MDKRNSNKLSSKLNSVQIKYAYFCHKGKIRANNEDNYWCMGDMLPADHEGSEKVHTGSFFRNEGGLLAVFDGMGGESCGEIASYVGAYELGLFHAASKDLLSDDPASFLKEASLKMNQGVCSYEREHRIASMGSTMAAAAFGKDQLSLGNLGDSRIYQFDPVNKALQRISLDHVSSWQLWGKAPLTQYLGLPEDEMILEPYIVSVPYQDSFQYLICSDGLTDLLSETELQQILSSGSESLEKTAALLLERTLAAGGRDNVTAVLFEVKTVSESTAGHKPGQSFTIWGKTLKRKLLGCFTLYWNRMESGEVGY